jgi:hypothetical protein
MKVCLRCRETKQESDFYIRRRKHGETCTNCKACQKSIDALKGKTYLAWQSMKQRCLNQSKKSYRRYGERGISVCERWASSYSNFVADMGEAPDGLSLDRIDNDGNYEPLNCRWASSKEQSRNKSGIRHITFDSQTMCIRDWEKRLGLSIGGLYHRFRRGWSIDKALTTPRNKV